MCYIRRGNVDIIHMSDKSYLEKNGEGLLRTVAFAVAWGVALFASMAADSIDSSAPTNTTANLNNYNIRKYDHNLSSLAWLQLGGFGFDLLLHILGVVGFCGLCGISGIRSAFFDLGRELSIIGTSSLGMIAFVAGMVKLDGVHAAKDDNERLYYTAVATYSFLASSILAMARVRNIGDKPESDKDKMLFTLDSDKRKEGIEEGNLRLGARYNKVPQVEAHNFY